MRGVERKVEMKLGVRESRRESGRGGRKNGIGEREGRERYRRRGDGEKGRRGLKQDLTGCSAGVEWACGSNKIETEKVFFFFINHLPVSL